MRITALNKMFYGIPSIISVIAISDTEIDILFSSTTISEDGFSIERSVNGIDYVEIDTVSAGVYTYSDTGLTHSTRYYYRIRAYKGTRYTGYSNVDSTWTEIIPSGLVLWKDGDNVTITESGVSIWNELSTSGNIATQTTDARRPLSITNQINGHSIVRATQSNIQWLALNSAITLLKAGCSVFIVVKLNDLTINSTLLGNSATNTYQFYRIVADNTIPKGGIACESNVNADDWLPVTTNLGIDTDNYFLLELHANAGAISFLVNAVSKVSGTPSNDLTINRLFIGTSNNSLSGDIAEIIIYNNVVLSDVNKQSIRDYLNEKYGELFFLSETNNLLARLEALPETTVFNFNTTFGIKKSIDKAMRGLVSSGIMDRAEFIGFNNTHTRLLSLMNWKQDKYNLWYFDGVEWTIKSGFKGDGIQGYLTTFFNPLNDQLIMESDDSAYGIYVESNDLTDAKELICVGNYGGNPQTDITVRTAYITNRINQGLPGSMIYYHLNNINGLLVLDRIAEDDIDLWVRGNKIDIGSTSDDGLPDFIVRFLGGIGANFSKNKMSFGYIGASLGALNTNLKSIIDTFKIDMNREISDNAITGFYQTNRPMLTIIYDDGDTNQIGWKDIHDAYGVPACLAVLTDVLDEPDHLTFAEVLTLQTAGWEILLHGDVDLPEWTDDTVEEVCTKIEACLATLTANGVTCQNMRPNRYGQSSLAVRAAASKYFNSSHVGYTVANGVNPQILDHWNLNAMRGDISSDYMVTEELGRANVKAAIDTCINENRWAIYFLHDWTQEKEDGLAEILSYRSSEITKVTIQGGLDLCDKI